jgi:hypothetical protein
VAKFLRMWRKVLTCVVLVVGFVAPSPAQAGKLPTDQGLQVFLKPDVLKLKVGKAETFTLTFTDDDASSVQGTLDVESIGGAGMSGEALCTTPAQRQAGGGVEVVQSSGSPGSTGSRLTSRQVPATALLLAWAANTSRVSRTVSVTR